MMPHRFLNNPEVDSSHPNLNDNETFNHNGPTVAGVFQNLPTIDHNSNYKKIQIRRYLCGGCAENILECDLIEHHTSTHPETPFTIDMYELFEIDEQFQCVICNLNVIEDDFTKHNHECSNESSNESTTNYNEIQTQHLYSDIETLPVIETKNLFKCTICKSTLTQRLRHHHKKLHGHIPDDVNIFETEIEQKVRCDVCHKLMTPYRLVKHRQKYHPDKYGQKQSHEIQMDVEAERNEWLDNSFRNIRISNEAFERFFNQNRIYEVDGYHYLKDSE